MIIKLNFSENDTNFEESLRIFSCTQFAISMKAYITCAPKKMGILRLYFTDYLSAAKQLHILHFKKRILYVRFYCLNI